MDSSNMVLTKSKNNATRAMAVKFVTRSSKKFAGSKKGVSRGTPNKFAGPKSPMDKEHQSVSGIDRKSTIMSTNRG